MPLSLWCSANCSSVNTNLRSGTTSSLMPLVSSKAYTVSVPATLIGLPPSLA